MKYLITGGAGFIGSHLVEKLVSSEHEVTVLDNLTSGSTQNLIEVKNQIRLIEGSILDRALIDNLVSKNDFIVHLAATLGVLNIVTKPLESLETNLIGAEVVLQAANKFNKPILLASTSEIYGKNNKVPLNEEDDRILGHPLKLRWSYSEAKAIDESLGYFFYLKNKLPIRIVRLFNTVGPRQIGDYGMVIPRFVNAALKNDPLEVYGSGDQIRCFCHVSDVINALIKVIDSDKTAGHVFNIGNNQPISIMNLAKQVIQITGSNSKINKLSYEQAYPSGYEDMNTRVPDISKIEQFLGWRPEISLDQIIKDIFVYFKKNL